MPFERNIDEVLKQILIHPNTKGQGYWIERLGDFCMSLASWELNKDVTETKQRHDNDVTKTKQRQGQEHEQ